MKLWSCLILLAGCYLHHEVGDPAPDARACVAGRSALPDAPRELWAFETGASSGPEHPAIDARGWIYFVIDTDPETTVVGDTLIALRPNGRLGWSWSDGSRLGSPFPTCEGIRLFSRTWVEGAPRVDWVRVDRRGREVSRVSMPSDTHVNAFIHREEIVVVRSTFDSDRLRLSRFGMDGAERWTIERTGYSFGTPTHNDALIVVSRLHGGEPSRTTLEAFTHEGDSLWTHDLDGHVLGPIVASDDSVYLSIAREDGSQTTRALELDGSIRWALDFAQAGNWQTMATHGRTLVLRDWETIVAVDAYTAEPLWSHDAHPNIDYAPVFDRDGALLLSGGFSRLDPRSGALLWSFNGARRTETGFAFATPATIAGERRIVFGAHNGEIVMIGD